MQRIPRDQQPEDERSGRYLLTDDTADALAAGGTIEVGDTWSAWDWARWSMPYVATALIAGPILLVILELLAPWDWR